LKSLRSASTVDSSIIYGNSKSNSSREANVSQAMTNGGRNGECLTPETRFSKYIIPQLLWGYWVRVAN
jgi:hypothetical protein